MKEPTRQCPCKIPSNEKRIITYQFPIVGKIQIYVCDACLEKDPYSKCILEIGEKID